MSDTYTIKMGCTNCDQDVNVEIPKGTSADGEHECPNCGCPTASKKLQPIFQDAPPPRRDVVRILPPNINFPLTRIEHHEHHHYPTPDPQQPRFGEFWCSVADGSLSAN